MKKIFFFHITKTAGSSLRALLYDNYEEVSIYDSCATGIDPNVGSDYLFMNRDSIIPSVKCIMGHYRSNIIPIIPADFFRFTFLRDPVVRAISWFYYLKKSNKHVAPLTIEEFFYEVPYSSKFNDNIVRAYFKQATNVYVRSFTNNLGKDIGYIKNKHCEDAITNMMGNFDYVGFVERFDESVFILSKLCDFNTVYYAKENVIYEPKTYRNLKVELGDELYDTVVDFNKYDIKLYSYARSYTRDFFKKFIAHNHDEFVDSKGQRNLKKILGKYFEDIKL